jgi:alpha-amylase
VDYCGGGYKGIKNNLDYIQGMGFDAIWISPIIDNRDGGYHGYWGRNIYKLNDHFGSEQDFVDLVSACHSRNILVMVDVVANHMGNLDTNFGVNNPFNDASHYHDWCDITDSDFANRNQDRI